MQPADSEGAPRVLVVVDEPDLAATCVRFLQQAGYAPRMVQSGEEALPLVDDRWPDLVLADARLPGTVDGLAILRRARRGARPAPVILCVGRASDLSRRQALEAGAAEYVVKPFSLADLRGAVERALGRRGAQERLRAR